MHGQKWPEIPLDGWIVAIAQNSFVFLAGNMEEEKKEEEQEGGDSRSRDDGEDVNEG